MLAGGIWDDRVVRTYDLDSANARIAEIRPLLVALRADRALVAEEQTALAGLEGRPDDPAVLVERDHREAAIRAALERMEGTVRSLTEWSVALRDIERGLIDLPALVNGVPVWLCWRLGEGAIGWWHAADEGFAGRKPIAELPMDPGGRLS